VLQGKGTIPSIPGYDSLPHRSFVTGFTGPLYRFTFTDRFGEPPVRTIPHPCLVIEHFVPGALLPLTAFVSFQAVALFAYQPPANNTFLSE
jgi:hypothetical protein